MTFSRRSDLARIVRRSLVTAGVTASLIVGAAAIRTAADWTAGAALKQDPPAGIAELEARVSDDQDRSAALRARIEQLAASSARIAELIQAAQGRTSLDEVAARTLEEDLSRTKAALTAHNAQVAAQPAPRPAAQTTTGGTTTATTTTATRTTTTTSREASDDHEDDHHDEHDD